jgi:hypothetical protein
MIVMAFSCPLVGFLFPTLVKALARPNKNPLRAMATTHSNE